LRQQGPSWYLAKELPHMTALDVGLLVGISLCNPWQSKIFLSRASITLDAIGMAFTSIINTCYLAHFCSQHLLATCIRGSLKHFSGLLDAIFNY